MKMMNEKREEGARMTGRLATVPDKVLNQNYTSSGELELQRAAGYLFEVRDRASIHAVDVDRRTCTCGYWQLLRMPCKHACAAIEKMQGDIYDYCDPYYTVEYYKMTYNEVIYPLMMVSGNIGDENDDVFVFPPDVRVQPGRRRKRRIPSQVETGKSRCSLCKRCGHNRRSCKEAHISDL